MDGGIQAALINRLFADALRKAEARRLGFVAALDVDGYLHDAATGLPAAATQKAGFRALIGAIAADGVLTEGERRQIAAWLQQHGLTLEQPGLADRDVDIDGIDLPDPPGFEFS